ncbi:CERS1 synthase, partial [Poecile atricapillus]|nr:CERS1 synthase [Poecile atricapillus]
CKLQPKDAAKMPESAWKLIFYSLSWSYGAYLLFCTDYPFFHDPPSVFYGWHRGMAVPGDPVPSHLGPVLSPQGGTGAWRCPVTSRWLSVLALLLFPGSGMRLCWLWLCPAVPRIRDEAVLALSPLNPLCLCPCRFWFRLYWFPLKVLYATCHSSLQSVPNIPFYFFFNALLLVLTLMNIYWFLYIVLFVAKVLLGQMQEVNDVREYDVEESRKA